MPLSVGAEWHFSVGLGTFGEGAAAWGRGATRDGCIFRGVLTWHPRPSNGDSLEMEEMMKMTPNQYQNQIPSKEYRLEDDG